MGIAINRKNETIDYFLDSQVFENIDINNIKIFKINIPGDFVKLEDIIFREDRIYFKIKQAGEPKYKYNLYLLRQYFYEYYYIDLENNLDLSKYKSSQIHLKVDIISQKFIHNIYFIVNLSNLLNSFIVYKYNYNVCPILKLKRCGLILPTSINLKKKHPFKREYKLNIPEEKDIKLKSFIFYLKQLQEYMNKNDFEFYINFKNFYFIEIDNLKEANYNDFLNIFNFYCKEEDEKIIKNILINLSYYCNNCELGFENCNHILNNNLMLLNVLYKHFYNRKIPVYIDYNNFIKQIEKVFKNRISPLFEKSLYNKYKNQYFLLKYKFYFFNSI